MSRLAGLLCVTAFLLLHVNFRNERFSKYTQVDAYEVRPGILMMPRYSASGEVCRVVLQKDHYAKGMADLDSTVPDEAVTDIFDELVQPNERGPLNTDSEMARLSLYSGDAVTASRDYEYVSFRISRLASSAGDIVAVIEWKGRSCQ